MAHNLNRVNGKDAFYSLRTAGWHGLGQVVDRPVTDPEVLDLAGLNWEAKKVGLFAATMDVVTTHKAMIRSDTSEILGIVGCDYAPVQNSEMLDWFRQVAGTKDMTVETAGALGKGETVWALAKIPGLRITMGEDVSDSYMLITSGHDGKSPLRIMPTTVRVVCQNTLRMATANRRHKSTLESGWSIRHTSGIKTAMTDIADAYARTLEDYEATRVAFRALADKRCTDETLSAIIGAAFPRKADEQGSESDRAKAIREKREAEIRRIRRGVTCNVKGTEGTVFADLQAVTEWIDHESRDDDAARFASAMFGGSLDEAKANAWGMALALV